MKENQPFADALFGKARKASIAILFSQPESAIHLREIARLANVSAPVMARELGALVAGGILLSKKDGNRVLFNANTKCPIYAELCGIARKIIGNRETFQLPANHREEKTRKQKAYLASHLGQSGADPWANAATTMIEAPSL